MKAMLLDAPHSMKLVEIPTPEPGQGEVRVRVLATGICGSELDAWEGRHEGRKAPVITGHEVCGLVDKIGPGVAGFAPGDKVVALPQQGCGTCEWCLGGQPNRCANRLMLGFTRWPGSYAEYFIIPASLLYKVDADLDPEIGALVEPLAVGVHAVRRMGVTNGVSIGIFGSGAIGLCSLLAARAAGATTLVAVDIAPFNLEVAQKTGASYVFNSGNPGLETFLRDVTAGRGLDGAVMAVGAPSLVEPVLHSMATGGTISIVARYAVNPPFDLQYFKAHELNMAGSITYRPEDYEQAARLTSKFGKELALLVTHRFHMEEAAQAFHLATRERKDMIRVLFHW